MMLKHIPAFVSVILDFGKYNIDILRWGLLSQLSGNTPTDHAITLQWRLLQLQKHKSLQQPGVCWVSKFTPTSHTDGSSSQNSLGFYYREVYAMHHGLETPNYMIRKDCTCPRRYPVSMEIHQSETEIEALKNFYFSPSCERLASEVAAPRLVGSYSNGSLAIFSWSGAPGDSGWQSGIADSADITVTFPQSMLVSGLGHLYQFNSTTVNYFLTQLLGPITSQFIWHFLLFYR